MNVVAFNGTKVILTEERMRHIKIRHPELAGASQMILDAVANPDEVYIDSTGAFHALM